MKPYLQLIRPGQWVKNLLLLAPLFFAGVLTDAEKAIPALLAVIAFSLCASSIYILNDYFDRERDRLHPEKKLRPLAAGTISPQAAGIGLLVLLSVGLLLAAWLNPNFGFLLATYCLLNLAYSYRLKHVPIVDLTILSSGFILRILSGGVVADVYISKWILIMTFLLSLFIGLAKRRDDLIQEGAKGKELRPVMDGYNLEFLHAAMSICAAVVIVAYVLYTVIDDPEKKLHSDSLYITSVFVLLSILRYLQLTFVEKKSGNPTRILFSDSFLQINLLLWIITYIYFLYVA